MSEMATKAEVIDVIYHISDWWTKLYIRYMAFKFKMTKEQVIEETANNYEDDMERIPEVTIK